MLLRSGLCLIQPAPCPAAEGLPPPEGTTDRAAAAVKLFDPALTIRFPASISEPINSFSSGRALLCVGLSLTYGFIPPRLQFLDALVT